VAPSLAAVSTAREWRAFTSCIAVYSSCLTQTLLQLLKRISVRLLSSTGTGTSTSTRLLQVPRINSMSPVRHVCISLPFGHNWTPLCTAVCSTHNVTSSTASCVLLFNGDVQTPHVLSQYKCHLNTLHLLINKDTFSANLSPLCTITFRIFQFQIVLSTLYLKHTATQYDRSMHSCNVTDAHCSYMFRLLQSNHHQAVYRTDKRKLFPF